MRDDRRKRERPRFVGDVPADYSGPVFWRLYDDVLGPVGDEGFRWASRNDPRFQAIFDNRNRGPHILTSGVVLDGQGELLPDLKPLLRATVDRSKRVAEFLPGTAAVTISDRVREAIDAVDKYRRVYLPVDVANGGGTERFWIMTAVDSDARFDDGPLLHPVRNGLRRIEYSERVRSWREPWPAEELANRFLTLDRRAVGDRQILRGGTMIDNAWVFGPALWERLEPMGDIFPRSTHLVPAGIADEPWDEDDISLERPPETSDAVRPTWLERIFGPGRKS